jgi:hypothetical protein
MSQARGQTGQASQETGRVRACALRPRPVPVRFPPMAVGTTTSGLSERWPTAVGLVVAAVACAAVIAGLDVDDVADEFAPGFLREVVGVPEAVREPADARQDPCEPSAWPP